MSSVSIPFLRAEEGDRTFARLRSNLIAWLTTVDPSGQPWTTPVWSLQGDDGTLLLCTPAGSAKLRHLVSNPRVSLALDVSDLGRSVVRIRGRAHVDREQPAARDNGAYRNKYTERIAAMSGDVDHFSERFSVPLVVVPILTAA